MGGVWRSLGLSVSLLQVRRALTTSLYCFYCLQICNAEFIKFTPSFLLIFYGVKFSDSDARDPRKFNSCFIFFARLAASASKIVKRPLCRCSFVKFNPLAAVARAPNLAHIKERRDIKRRPIFFSWIAISAWSFLSWNLRVATRMTGRY